MVGVGFVSNLKSEVMELQKLTKTSDEKIVLLDIGANIGSYTAEFRKAYPKSKVIAFEPSKKSYETLRKMFAEDPFVETYNLGFSDSVGIAQLWSNELGSSQSSLFQRVIHHQSRNSEKLSRMTFDVFEHIEVTTLDIWLHENSVSPTHLKLDTEGSEFLILQGAKNTLRKLEYVQFEYGGTATDARICFRDYWELFQEMNFELFRVTPRGVLEIDEYSWECETSLYSVYFAVKRV
jgi:FkbM family methyltransferase